MCEYIESIKISGTLNKGLWIRIQCGPGNVCGMTVYAAVECQDLQMRFTAFNGFGHTLQNAIIVLLLQLP